MFDTHSHIQFKVFEKNIAEVIDNAKKAGVNKIIALIGIDGGFPRFLLIFVECHGCIFNF